MLTFAVVTLCLPATVATTLAAVQTAPFWSEELAAIDRKRDKIRQMRYFLDFMGKAFAEANLKMLESHRQ